MRGMIGLVVGAALALGLGPVLAAESRYFSIATAGEAGTYFPVGQALAAAVSAPPGLVVSAVASNGSIANVEAIAGGGAQSGLVQADVARWAFEGTGVFEARGARPGLRAIAALYPEAVHLLVRKEAGIHGLADLAGKHVSVDEPGSGTLADVRLILAAAGLSERDFTAEYYKADLAAQLTASGGLDGFFFVGGWPAPAIAKLAAQQKGAFALVPLTAGEGFARETIPDEAYPGIKGVETLAVRTLWLTDAGQPAEVIEAITAALWSEQARAILDAGHPQGKAIRLESALDGLTVPLHPGAEAFYRKAGLIK